MAIKAIGTITGNPGNGRTLKVDWKPVTPPRDWYFYFHPKLVWKVLPGSWQTRALIAFTFEGKPQDIDRFRNAPYWRERFGDDVVDARRFNWTRFYEEMADKLLGFRSRRDELISGIHAIATREKGFSQLQDRFADGTSGPLKDICPFTIMGMFNRGITETNRKTIAGELANLLGASEPVPTSFEGIPLLNNQRSWFFGFENQRQPGDIDALWEVFSQAIAFTDSDGAEAKPAFVAAYNAVTHQFVIGWNLTMGLYWIRPWNFSTLDDHSRRYITNKLNIQISMTGPKGRCTADAYLTLLDDLSIRFQEPDYPVHSFPDLSLAAYQPAGSGITAPDPDDDSAEAPPIISIPTHKPYVRAC